MLEDVTKEHIVQEMGLRIEPLSLEQAIIIQGYTGYKLVPDDVFQADINRRAQFVSPLHEGKVDLSLMFGEDFKRLVPGANEHEMTDLPVLEHRLFYMLIDKLDNDPFGRWDTRVDVLVDCHINHKIQSNLRLSLDLYREVTIEFTERPGDREQTWIVMNRPSPTQSALGRSVITAWEMLLKAIRSGEEGWTEHTVVVPFSIPYYLQHKFKHMLFTKLVDVADLHAIRGVWLSNGRFTRHETSVTLKK